MLTGALGAGNQILETAVDAARSGEAVCATRNAILLGKMLASINPEILEGIVAAVGETLGSYKKPVIEPPGLFALLSQFRHKELRRSVALINRFLESLGQPDQIAGEVGELPVPLQLLHRRKSMKNRWGMAVAGFFMQVALGAVYAWSVFRNPLIKKFGWSVTDVTLTFTICIFVLGVAAFFGGLWLNKKGPRVVALTGGFLYGLGVFLASYTSSLGGSISPMA